MNRYISSFFITIFIYISLVSSFYFLFSKNIEKKEDIKKSKTLSLSHIKLETNKKESTNKELKKKKIIEKKKTIKKRKEFKKHKTKVKKQKNKISKKIKSKNNKVEKNIKKEPIKKKEKLKHNKKIYKQVNIEPKKDIKKEYFDKYFHVIRQEIQENIVYSKRAKRFNIQGVVKVKFKISKNGMIDKIDILKGHRLLRKSTIEAIKKASKNFPKVPKSLIITLPIEYRLI